jgi:hypothetical protein
MKIKSKAKQVWTKFTSLRRTRCMFLQLPISCFLKFSVLSSSQLCLYLPSGLPFKVSYYNFVCVCHLPHASYILHSSHCPWFDCPVFVEEYKLWLSSLCSFIQPSVYSSLLGLHILFSTLLSSTLILCSFQNMRDQVSQPCEIFGKVTVLYILILILVC